jgi:6-phosphogluconate dehydrogenase
MKYKVFLITGVSGSGKTTIGKAIAERLNIPFYDGDDFHPMNNISKMSSGIPLSDDDRWPWLKEINAFLHKKIKSKNLVLACSALKNDYRNILSEGLSPSQITWIHLEGDFDTIYQRLSLREGHYMSHHMLQSQFDIYQKAEEGITISIANDLDTIIENIMSNILTSKSDIGLIGLGVMGTSLARNISQKGYQISLYNRHVPQKEENIALCAVVQYPELEGALPFDDLSLFIASLASPRRVFLMVNAGQAVDDIVSKLLPLLSIGDVIVDGGNSYFKDTEQRQKQCAEFGIHFLGCGVSGGEEGALKGPSIMPGGSKLGFSLLKDILYAISAKNVDGEICCEYIGEGGSGHFVKMVHNGIEYAEMQLIAEVYSHLRYDQKMILSDIADIFESWNRGEEASYLLEITVEILRFKDDDGQPLLDKISDVAANKGTGSWTTIVACEMGIPIPGISSALFARYLSSFKSKRLKYHTLFSPSQDTFETDIHTIKQTYTMARILNHDQGVRLIKEASETYQWGIDLSALFKTWSGGCIIRSKLLQRFRHDIQGSDNDLLLIPFVAEFIKENMQLVRKTMSILTLSNQPYPTLHNNMEYLKYLTQSASNANLIQAQRDYFGAHTYRRIDDESGTSFHTQWY